MRSNLPPLLIDGPDQPHALDNLPIRSRPAHGDIACGHCRGRGAWNEMLHLDSMRCRLAICGDCDGSGWLSHDGSRTIPDIVCVDGHPAWTLRHLPPTAAIVCLVTAPHARPAATQELEAA